MLLPKIFFLKTDGIAQEWVPSIANFILRRRVKVYNILTKTCEIRAFDRSRIKNYQKDYKALMEQLTETYDSLYKNLSTAHERMTKRDFWNKYLGLTN